MGKTDRENRDRNASGAEDPRKLLGEYPVQDPQMRPPEDLAGEIWGVDIDSYPLREKEADPRWAVRTVWLWFGIAVTCIVFVGTLIVLGAIYD
jgi:hypothetical protein